MLNGPPRTPQALTKHQCLLFSTRAPNAWRFVVTRKPIDVKVSGRFESNNLAMIRDAAVAAMGLARLPDVLAHDAVSAGTLVQVLEKFAAPEAALHAVFPSSQFVPSKLRAFIDILRQRMPAS